MECVHPGPIRVASSSQRDGDLEHNFLGQETHTQLLPSCDWGGKVPNCDKVYQPLGSRGTATGLQTSGAHSIGGVAVGAPASTWPAPGDCLE